MAKGKGGRTSASGPRRVHGPKRHMHAWCGAMKKLFADAGLLDKYHDYESWLLAMAARGCKKADKSEFDRFFALSMEEKKAYFDNAAKK